MNVRLQEGLEGLRGFLALSCLQEGLAGSAPILLAKGVVSSRRQGKSAGGGLGRGGRAGLRYR